MFYWCLGDMFELEISKIIVVVDGECFVKFVYMVEYVRIVCWEKMGKWELYIIYKFGFINLDWLLGSLI